MQRRLLIGTYECSLDDRFRLAIPARLRGPFADGTTVARWLDPCLVLVPTDDFDRFIEETFGRLTVLEPEQRELSAWILGGAFHQPPLDRQGRLVIPQKLRELAGLDGQVEVVGAGGYLEVWNPERLEKRFDELEREGVSNRAKRLAERLA